MTEGFDPKALEIQTTLEQFGAVKTMWLPSFGVVVAYVDFASFDDVVAADLYAQHGIEILLVNAELIGDKAALSVMLSMGRR